MMSAFAKDTGVDYLVDVLQLHCYEIAVADIVPLHHASSSYILSYFRGH